MKEIKTSYRNVHKSEHLGVLDLEELLDKGKKLVFRIKEVKQEIGVRVAGSKGDYNIAYFTDPNIKPLVLNVTNSKVISRFNNNSQYVEDWANTLIELYIDQSVKMKGEVVGGVRIKPVQPREEKPIFDESQFEKAFESNVSLERILKTREASEEVQQKYIDYCNERNRTKE